MPDTDTKKPTAVFTQGSLFRHISVMSFTASIGLMAVFLVDFVDMIFISMLGKAELAAAVGYAGAILVNRNHAPRLIGIQPWFLNRGYVRNNSRQGHHRWWKKAL